jgi:hypothetical protein
MRRPGKEGAGFAGALEKEIGADGTCGAFLMHWWPGRDSKRTRGCRPGSTAGADRLRIGPQVMR